MDAKIRTLHGICRTRNKAIAIFSEIRDKRGRWETRVTLAFIGQTLKVSMRPPLKQLYRGSQGLGSSMRTPPVD